MAWKKIAESNELIVLENELKDYKLKIEARKSNVFSNIPEKFDTILLNPPQTAGKALCFRMIEESFKHLNEKGSLQVVARHKKGGKGISEKMESVFGSFKIKAIKSGFRVYASWKN